MGFASALIEFHSLGLVAHITLRLGDEIKIKLRVRIPLAHCARGSMENLG